MLTLELLASNYLTNPSDQHVHGVVEIQVSRPLLIQAGQTYRTMLQANVLTGLPEGSQVLAVDVGFIIIEEIKHLLYGVEVSGELGPMYLFVS
ncbi:hypothetical protein D3C75_1228730 [compost metagenome]